MATASKAPRARKTWLSIDVIELDPRLQPREDGLNPEHVADLRAAVKKKVKLPLPRVWLVQEDGKGTTYYLTDGWHTLAANADEGRFKVECEVREGAWLDAVADAAAANTGPTHTALKRTDADKRRAVWVLTAELAAAGQKWSNRRVAEACRVSEGLVRLVLGEADPIEADAAGPAPGPAATANGKHKPKAKAGGPVGDAPANGTPKIDWHRAGESAGVVIRLADTIAGLYPQAKADPDLKTFQTHIGKALDVFETLKERYSK